MRTIELKHINGNQVLRKPEKLKNKKIKINLQKNKVNYKYFTNDPLKKIKKHNFTMFHEVFS